MCIMFTIYKFMCESINRISGEGIIKVADFGLSEDVYTTEYFKQDRSADESVKLPLKWMALESIHYGKFSEKTDVVCEYS